MKAGCKFHIGTSGWIYPHWQGTFYPNDLPKNQWFQYYCSKFSTVEINATFYRAFKDSTYLNWYQKAPENFKYVIKAHRLITHRKYLHDVAHEIQQCWQSANVLQEKLGLILLQLPPKMPYDPDRLKQALLAFSEPQKIAVEFRNHKWLTPETKNLLTELQVAFCTSDAPGIDLIDWLTAKIGYIRLHSQNQDLPKIANLAKKMAKNGAKEIYIFFNNDFAGFAPKDAEELITSINN